MSDGQQRDLADLEGFAAGQRFGGAGRDRIEKERITDFATEFERRRGVLPGVVLAVGFIVLGLLLDFAPWRDP